MSSRPCHRRPPAAAVTARILAAAVGPILAAAVGPILAAAVGPILVAAAAADRSQLPLATPESLAAQVVGGRFEVLPAGGPGGEAVIEFADPVETGGAIEVDLAGIDLEGYDELRFELWMENDPVDVTVTLRGFPDDHRGRRWYAFKRFQPLGEWTDIRLALDLDDDLSGERFDEAEKRLVLRFSRAETAGDAFARARLHGLRLVRNPLRVDVDYRESSVALTEEGLALTYPVHLENRTDREVTPRLEVIPETLDRFRAALGEVPTLAPGARGVTSVTLTIGPEHATLPTGYVERARLRCLIPDQEGSDVVPIRGYRPVYLFGIVPPRGARQAVFERLRQAAAKADADIARYAADLAWQVEKPPGDITPVHPAAFRCPECASALRVAGLHECYCVSYGLGGFGSGQRCPKHEERFTVTEDQPLFRPLLHNYHMHSASTARRLALGWLRTGDRRLADKAVEILADYEAMYRDLAAVAPQSVAFQSRFCSGSLFERHFLEQLVETWLILHETEAADPAVLEAFAAGILADSLRITNLHYYSFSASQIDMVTQALKAAVILEKWPYVADALAGDAGVGRILARNFTADGVPIDGGDYATQAARQIMTLAGDLKLLGIGVEQERIAQIERNSTLLGFLPRPENFQMRTTVLDRTGFTILVNGKGPTLRRATINWGSTRERGGHDHLTTVFHDDADEELTLRTRRVMWGHPHAFIAFQSFAQNIPVVDEASMSGARKRQEYLRDDPRAAGLIIADDPERPAYPACRLHRTLVLFDGCLLVVDRLASESGERQFDFPVNGLTAFAEPPADLAAFEGELGEAAIYRLPHELRTAAVQTQPFTARWAEGGRELGLHMLGDGFQVFAGKTFMGRHAQSITRDFLMFRTRGRSATAAFLYEARHAAAPRVKGFARAAAADEAGRPVGDDRALAYDVSFAEGRTVRVLVSLDGGSYRAGSCQADARTRIALTDLE